VRKYYEGYLTMLLCICSSDVINLVDIATPDDAEVAQSFRFVTFLWLPVACGALEHISMIEHHSLNYIY
jgi:hypothetical protein